MRAPTEEGTNTSLVDSAAIHSAKRDRCRGLKSSGETLLVPTVGWSINSTNEMRLVLEKRERYDVDRNSIVLRYRL